LTDVASVLGSRQLTRIEEFNARRRELAQHYRHALAQIEELQPLADPEYPCEHARHLFIVRLDIDAAGLSRDDFMAELKKRQIGTGLHFRAVHLQRYYREAHGCVPGMLPETEWNSDRIFSLPLFPNMKDEDVGEVIEAVKDVLHKRGRV
jgi:UDP-4-amino-4-deoxy-L-arabinose-oxoglutarate aminotransferase